MMHGGYDGMYRTLICTAIIVSLFLVGLGVLIGWWLL